MKIIFSRKGFDSGTGCIPSPIMPDGTMISLPIPDRFGTVAYGDLACAEYNVGKLVTDLKGKRKNRKNAQVLLTASDRAHLDPDLSKDICTRTAKSWRPALGQCGSAAGVLHNHNIGAGDLFLFFGWFRQCETFGDTYRYVRGAQDIHALFGYLRVGSVIKLAKDPIPDWAQHHPHLHGTRQGRNVLYVGADTLGLPSCEYLSGAGTFKQFTHTLQLTAPSKNRSVWRVPRWMYPDNKKPPLSSHERRDRWQLFDDSCQLKSVGRGQEFVLDTNFYPEAVNWALSFISAIKENHEISGAGFLTDK